MATPSTSIDRHRPREEESSMPHAFVTGATGFIGSEVAMQLCEAGWAVTATRRATSNTDALRDYDIDWVEVNLHDAGSVTEAMPDGIDGVFHVAGNLTFWKKEFDDQYRDNVVATRALVEAALRCDAGRFIFTSSGAAYGQQAPPYHEGLTSQAMSSPVNYDRTKYLAECEIRRGIEKGLNAVILNPAAVLGPRDPNFTVIFEQLVAEKLPAAMPTKTSFCHVREVARAHLCAYERGRVGENYLLGGTNTSHLELAQVFARKVGCKVPTRIMPVPVLYAMGAVFELVSLVTRKPPMLTRKFATAMTHCWYTCSDKAIEELGYAPPSLEELVDDIAAWMRSEGKLA
jgi:dihydroflavonol-4-reductase